MTRKKWTSPEQENWLKSRVAEFRLAEVTNSRKKFFKETYAEWLLKWPNAEPTQEGINHANSREQAVKDEFMKQDLRIKNWYRNHKRPTTSQKSDTKTVGNSTSASSYGLLKFKKKRMLQKWQAYHELTYESKWKAIVDKQWAKKVEEWDAENHGVPIKSSARFIFMINFMKERYEEETDEMKNIVEEHRHKAMEAPADSLNATYQTNIEKLPRTMAVMANSIFQQTGWYSTIILGGPVPADGGDISTLIYHGGRTEKGQNFESFVGKELFETSVGRKFDDFLHEAFNEEVRTQRATSEPCSEDSMGSDEKEEDDEVFLAEAKAKADRIKGGGGISEYERIKQQNIAKNKAILEQLNLLNVAKGIVDSAIDGGGKKGKADMGEHASKTKSAEPGEEKQVSPQQQTTGGLPPVVSRAASASASLNESTKSASDRSSSFNTEPIENSHPHDPEKPSKTDTKYSPVSTEDRAKGDEYSREDHVRGMTAGKELAEGMKRDGGDTEIAEGQDHSADQEITISDSGFKNSRTSDNAENHTHNGDPIASTKSNTSPIVASSLPPSINIDSSLSDQSDTDITSTRQISLAVAPAPLYSLEEDLDGAPAFLTSDIIQYLRDISVQPAWQDLVDSYLVFEKGGPICGKLPTDWRPKQVAPWIKRHIHKKHEPIPVDLGTYGKQFNSWWKAIQPPWRVLSGGTYNKKRKPQDEFNNVNKGGSSGLYVVLMALSWWAVAVGTSDGHTDMWAMVDDLNWVFKQLGTTKSLRKRIRSDEDPQPRANNKRRRL